MVTGYLQALRRSRAECARAPINQPTWTGRHGQSGAPGTSGGPHGPSPLGGSGTNGAGGSNSGGGGDSAAGKPRFGTVTAGRAGPGSSAGGAGTGRPLLPRGAPHANNNSNTSSNGREGSPARTAPGGALSSAALLAQARARQAPPPSSRHSAAGVGTGGEGGAPGGPQRESEEADLLAARIVSFLDAQHPGRDADSATVVAAFRTTVPQDGMPLFRQLLHEVRRDTVRAGGAWWVDGRVLQHARVPVKLFASWARVTGCGTAYHSPR